MDAQMVAAIARHVLTGIGGALAARYGIEGDAIEAIAGGAAALAGVLWSIADKRRRSRL